MNMPMITPPAERAHRVYARALAWELAEKFRLGDIDQCWLSQRLEKALRDYEQGLEQMCNEYAKIAGEALNLKVNPPFIMQNPTLDGVNDGKR